MTINTATALVTSALVGAIVLMLRPPGGKLVPVIALVAAAAIAAITYRVLQLPVAKLRLDVVLPAVLAVTGGLLWSRSSSRPTVTAATVVALVGLILLLSALRVLH